MSTGILNSPGSKNSLTTAAREHGKARIALREAEDDEWNNPSDPTAQRRVNFWGGEVTRLAAMPADTIIPLF